MESIDLRSDTVTKPTGKMREAMAQAEVGDNIYGEDPTVNELETLAAEVVGKEAALFVPSGTMGNLLAVMTHTEPGQEIILGQDSHIFYYEVGGLAKVAGVQARTLDDSAGIFTPQAVDKAVRKEDIHYPETGLICLENTHNRGRGVTISKEKMDQICDIAAEYKLPVHLDGARIFNAALDLGVEVKNLTANVDSVMFCLSKGLSAPVGSILAGSEEFIGQARKNRKMIGGGMRQVGVIAAAGIVALEEMVSRLEVDHKLAAKLASGVREADVEDIEVEAVNTNFVILRVSNREEDTEEFLSKLDEAGVKMTYFDPGLIRAVPHYGISEEDIDRVVEILAEI